MPKLPEWKIERYILGELPDEELRRIDKLRAEDKEIAAEIERLQASNREILTKYPAEEMVAKIRQRAVQAEQTEQRASTAGTDESRANLHAFSKESENSEETEERQSERSQDRRHRPFFALPQVVFPAALAAALALFILFSGQFAFLGLPGGSVSGDHRAGSGTGGGTTAQSGGPSGPAIQGLEGDTGIRLKGMYAGIQVFRKRGDDIEQLQPGTEASAGDTLQLGFFAPEAEYAVLFSVDGRGAVTLHAPISAQQSAELTEQQRVLLDAAYRLDDAPQFERFYLITSDSELDAAEVLGKVRSYIHRHGQFPASAGDLNSNTQLADISAGQITWYEFTLKK